MGPFPHNTQKAIISAENPAGTDGFEFVEFADTTDEKLRDTFTKMGFVEVAKHKSNIPYLHATSRQQLGWQTHKLG